MRPLLSAIAGAVCAALSLAGPARADDPVAAFYTGKQVTIVIGSSVGGGYDTYIRVLSRHFGKFIPGNPSVVPANMPGAGSMNVTGQRGACNGAATPSVRLQGRSLACPASAPAQRHQ